MGYSWSVFSFLYRGFYVYYFLFFVTFRWQFIRRLAGLVLLCVNALTQFVWLIPSGTRAISLAATMWNFCFSFFLIFYRMRHDQNTVLWQSHFYAVVCVNVYVLMIFSFIFL